VLQRGIGEGNMSSPKEMSPDPYAALFPEEDGKRWYERGHSRYISSDEEVMPDAYFYNQIGDLTLHEDESLAAITANPAVGLMPEPDPMLTSTGGAEETPDPNSTGDKEVIEVPETEEGEVRVERVAVGVPPGPGQAGLGMPRAEARKEPVLTPEVRELVNELVKAGIEKQLKLIEEGEPGAPNPFREVMANVVAKATGYKNGQKIIPKLPTFSGGEDEDYPVEQWLAIAEMQLEDFMQTKDRKEWVKVAAFHLRGTAQAAWYPKASEMKHNGVEITWTAFADFLKLAFGSDNPLEVAREELDKLSVASAGGVQEYIHKFRKHMTVLGDTRSAQDYVHRFVKGLPRFLVTGVRIHFADRPMAKVDELMAFVSKFNRDEVKTGMVTGAGNQANKVRI
jgi:hypothetical protein